HHAWSLVSELSDEEITFCRFAGAMGLTPDEVPDRLAERLEKLFPVLGERLLMDLCLVSRPDNFDTTTSTAEAAHLTLSEASAADMAPLFSVTVPADNFSVEAWHRGKRAAAQLRHLFRVSDTDPQGATRIFE